MDINLPGIDGNEALRRIRKINPLQCVIMLTAFATVDNAIQALKEGASDFVKKPFENEHLIHIVNQCLGKVPDPERERETGGRGQTALHHR